MGKRIETIDDAYIAALERHTWHGNVRELRNVVERSLIMADGERLSADTLSPNSAPAPAHLPIRWHSTHLNGIIF